MTDKLPAHIRALALDLGNPTLASIDVCKQLVAENAIRDTPTRCDSQRGATHKATAPSTTRKAG